MKWELVGLRGYYCNWCTFDSKNCLIREFCRACSFPRLPIEHPDFSEPGITHGSIIQALINPPIIEQRFIPSRWINWRVFTRKRLSCRAFIAVHKFVHTGRDVTRWQKWTDALNTNEYRWIGFSSPSCYPGNPINSAPYDTISNRSSPTGFSKPDRLYKSFDLTLLCLTRIETYESNAPSQWLFKYQQQYSRYGIITIE